MIQVVKNLLFLASGRGSNFKSFVDHIRLGILKAVAVKILVSNRVNAPVLEIARIADIATKELVGTSGRSFVSKEEREKARLDFDKQCLELVHQFSIDYVLLAGFDQILSKSFVDSMPCRILNIHPAYDLRAFGGKNMVGSKVHDSVVRSEVRYSGCTVHFVANEIDQGPAILKERVAILPDDTAGSLEQRILAYEHLLYPQALQLLVDGRVFLSDDRTKCYVDRFSDNWDIEWWKRQEAYLRKIQFDTITLQEAQTS